MKGRFKLFLFAWCVSVSAILGSVIVLLMLQNPGIQFQIAVVGFIVYTVILIAGVKILTKKYWSKP